MKSTWKRNGNYETIEEYIETKTGLPAEELKNPPHTNAADIMGIPEAAQIIRQAISDGKRIRIVGDYDVDGITSTSILTKALTEMGTVPETVIPRRFSDGYGIKSSMVEDMHDGLVITVDNGIVANDVIALAKANGNTVVILDHHIPGDALPDADLIVDPHKSGDTSEFKDYCGAGLSYKLVQYIHQSGIHTFSDKIIMDIAVLAGLGTVADVVPMIGDNRAIIQDALKIINDQLTLANVSAGVKCLLPMENFPFDSDTFGFTVAPCINACGRLYDAGGTSALKALLETDSVVAKKYAEKMTEINKKRKEIVADAEKKADETLEEQNGESILCICCDGIPEGVIGIVSGKISERMHRPCFTFSPSKDGQLKGSARSAGKCDIGKILPLISPYCEACGGHAGAAGVTVKPENFDKICNIIWEYGRENVPIDDVNSISYDFIVDENDIESFWGKMKEYGPYGEGLPKPTICVKSFNLNKLNGKGRGYALMGANKEHIRLFGEHMDAVAFGTAKKYIDDIHETYIFIGIVGENHYNGKCSIQLQIADQMAVQIG